MASMMIRVVLALSLSLSATAMYHPDKNTWAVTDAAYAYAWMSEFLPVYPADDGCGPPDDDDCSGCGVQGRVALCETVECSTDMYGVSSGFGLHTVNASTRPFGETNVDALEAAFDARLAAAFGAKDASEPFLDFSAVLFAASLDRYLEAFDAAAQPYLALQWADSGGTARYSCLVQIPTTMVVFELVSSAAPTTATWAAAVVDDELVRLPKGAFDYNSVDAAVDGVLIPIAISRATSDLAAVTEWYEAVTQRAAGATLFTASAGDAQLATFSLVTGQVMHMRFIERAAASASSNATTTASAYGTVAALEAAKNGAHAALNKDTEHFCGFDKYYDSHMGSPGQLSLDTARDALDALGAYYHVWQSPGYDMYAADPTGEAIQMMGSWSSYPSGASGNAGDLCCQGSSTCASVGTCTMAETPETPAARRPPWAAPDRANNATAAGDDAAVEA